MKEIADLFPNIKKFNFINETKIFNEIQNNKRILVLDLRPKKSFINFSLPNSVNLPYDEYSDEFFQKFINNITPDLSDDPFIKDMLKKFRRFYIAIIFSDEKFHRKDVINYDNDKIKSLNHLYKALSLYSSLTTNKVREIGIDQKGFSCINSKYWFLVRNNLNDPEIR